jgi:hypothetical protein
MFRKALTLHALSALLLMGGAFTQTSCSQNDKKEVSAESDQAYNDFKTFVADTEAKADAVATQADAEYEQETARLKAEFDAKVAAVDKYADQYDDARRQEIEVLRTRYTAAYDRRETARRNGATGASSRSGGTKQGKYYKPSSPAAALTAANARSTYEAFVRNIKQNEDKYDIDDWRNINTEWRAMDAKYDQIKGDVSGADKAEIAKEKLKYAAFKSFDKTEARASQVGDLVTGDKAEAKAKGEGVQVGKTASNVGNDLKETGKDVGQGAAKIGKGAVEVGKDVGQGAAKVGKKVGGAVKDVFDGKDNEGTKKE